MNGRARHLQRQAVASVRRDEARPGRVVAPELPFAEQRPALVDAQAIEGHQSDWTGLAAELGQLGRRLAARDQHTAPVRAFGQHLH